VERLENSLTRVVSSFTSVTGREVEDKAVTVLSYASGAIGVAETAFVSVNTPFTLELGGTKGSLIVQNGFRYATEATGDQWVEAAKDEYPAEMPDALHQCVAAFESGSKIIFGIDLAVSLTEVMEMAYTGVEMARLPNP